LQLVFQLFNT